ncbi:MAG TPA: circadian clock KaiB family protein [Candidatus Sulfopaludibacter sp.]|jgi:circadian clock protein KaiB|nr:circadian clock KaiB family protein [Candidatus Sulfopaludibacter sp.]
MRRKRPQNDTEAFEEADAAAHGKRRYQLRLFVSGSTPRSTRAIQNIRAICEERLMGRYDLEVVDIYQHPEQMKPQQIVVTPTLVKSLPLPLRRIIGDLSNKDRVLVGLGIILREIAEEGHGA